MKRNASLFFPFFFSIVAKTVVKSVFSALRYCAEDDPHLRIDISEKKRDRKKRTENLTSVYWCRSAFFVHQCLICTMPLALLWGSYVHPFSPFLHTWLSRPKIPLGRSWLGLSWAPSGSLGLSWALVGSLGLSWARFGPPGLSWSLLVSLGMLSWTLLVSPGLSWALLGSLGLSWALLGPHGLSCLCVVAHILGLPTAPMFPRCATEAAVPRCRTAE